MTDAKRNVPHTHVSRVLLARVIFARERTRKQLASEAGVSLPTVSAHLRELADAGLITTLRSEQGPMGRAAIVYGLGPAAGWLLGMDVGTTHIEAVAQSLDGRELARETWQADDRNAGPRDARAMVTRAAEIATTLAAALADRGPLRTVAVALSRIVPNEMGNGSLDPDRAAAVDEAHQFVAQTRLPAGTPIVFENNVNCSALAEHREGVARGRSHFTYLQLGVGIGLGIIADGRLLRGANGGGGEVAYIPFPWAPGSQIEHEGLQRHLSSDGPLFSRRQRSAEGLVDAQTLFDAALSGHEESARIISSFAGEVARLIAAVCAVTDPSMVVMGGGVGIRPELVNPVSQALRKLTVLPPEVHTSSLGLDATVKGAVLLASDHALRVLLREAYHPLTGPLPVLEYG